MDILNKIKGWASAITEVGISLISLAIVLEILFNGRAFRSGHKSALLTILQE